MIEDSPFQGIAGALLIIGLVFFLIIWYRDSNKIEDENNSRKEKYYKELDAYKLYKEKPDSLFKQFNTKDETYKSRLRKIQQSIIAMKRPNQYLEQRRGYTEDYFSNFLHKWFPERVFTNYTFEINPLLKEKYRPFLADFIFQGEDNLHIDIEIDEPYDLINLNPIHLFDKSNSNEDDTFRNHIFSNVFGWVVIRFSEDQIVNQPDECCRFIAEIILELTGNDQFLTNLKSYNNPTICSRWNTSDVLNMINQDHRKKYLSLVKNEWSYKSTWNNKIKLGPKPIFRSPNQTVDSSSNYNEDIDLPF
ncbi:MAG: hypothetical protein IPJ79_16635 [Bacteroidetes bacterium]|nr:hypothetical protein [Bacteroidota bacterium]